MTGDILRAKILSIQIIPNANHDLLKEFDITEEHMALGILSCDIDDVGYAALDHATKCANVNVVYAKSMYAGSSNASTSLAGEFIGVLASPNPESVKEGMSAAREYMEKDACFYSANDDDSVVYFAQCISRSGEYLSKKADIPAGNSLAYLIAPPVEAIYAMDAALKVAEVSLCSFYGPPSETNFAGGLLSGEQAACKAACQAFADAVCKVAQTPIVI